MVATPLSSYKGNQYRAGWYLFGHGWVYNKALFDKAGIPQRLYPPETWDEWLEVCRILKDAGITPISMGAKDQLIGDWLISLFMVQQLDSPRDPIKLCIGDLRWDDPRYYEHWARIKELWDKGYINDDVLSLDLYQGQDLFTKGEAAMTIAVGTIIPAMEKVLGAENIGVMKTPTFGVGKLAEKDVTYIQGTLISSQSKNKELAAEFIRLMHEKDRYNALWDDLGAIPADDRFDSKKIDDPLIKETWAGLRTQPFTWEIQSPGLYSGKQLTQAFRSCFQVHYHQRNLAKKRRDSQSSGKSRVRTCFKIILTGLQAWLSECKRITGAGGIFTGPRCSNLCILLTGLHFKSKPIIIR